jgi:hypothetical protein
LQERLLLLTCWLLLVVAAVVGLLPEVVEVLVDIEHLLQRL